MQFLCQIHLFTGPLRDNYFCFLEHVDVSRNLTCDQAFVFRRTGEGLEDSHEGSRTRFETEAKGSEAAYIF